MAFTFSPTAPDNAFLIESAYTNILTRPTLLGFIGEDCCYTLVSVGDCDVYLGDATVTKTTGHRLPGRAGATVTVTPKPDTSPVARQLFAIAENGPVRVLVQHWELPDHPKDLEAGNEGRPTVALAS